MAGSYVDGENSPNEMLRVGNHGVDFRIGACFWPGSHRRTGTRAILPGGVGGVMTKGGLEPRAGFSAVEAFEPAAFALPRRRFPLLSQASTRLSHRGVSRESRADTLYGLLGASPVRGPD